MPLAQLVQLPEGAVGGSVAGGGGSKQAKPRVPQQQDVCSLLVRVLLRMTCGQSLCLETVKAAWRELSFSHVFEAHRPGTSVDQHVQLLYAAALERLLAAIPSSAISRALQPLRKQHEEAAAAAEAERRQQEEQEQEEARLRDLLLQDLGDPFPHRDGEEEDEEVAAAIAAALPPLPTDIAREGQPMVPEAATAGQAASGGTPPLPTLMTAAGEASAAGFHPAAPAQGLLQDPASAGVAVPTPRLPDLAAAAGPPSGEQLSALPAAAQAPTGAQPAHIAETLSPDLQPGGVGLAAATAAGSSVELPGFALQQTAQPSHMAAAGSTTQLTALLPDPAGAVVATTATEEGGGTSPSAVVPGPAAAEILALGAADGMDLESLMLEFEDRQPAEQPVEQQPEQQQQPAGVSPADQQRAQLPAAAARQQQETQAQQPHSQQQALPAVAGEQAVEPQASGGPAVGALPEAPLPTGIDMVLGEAPLLWPLPLAPVVPDSAGAPGRAPPVPPARDQQHAVAQPGPPALLTERHLPALPLPIPVEQPPRELLPLPTEEQVQQLREHSLELQAAALLVLFCLHAAHPPLPSPGLCSVGEAGAAAPGPAPAAPDAAGGTGDSSGDAVTGSGAPQGVGGGGGRVKIYLSMEHQQALLGLVPQLAGCCPDALMALRQLREAGAFVLGASRRLVALSDEAAGGAQRLMPVPGLFHGLRGEELAVVREVRFQLDSTMKGLGTASLAQLCSTYQDSLSAMWGVVTDNSSGHGSSQHRSSAPNGGGLRHDGRDQPESIADLRLGSLLHEFTERKHAQLQLLVNHGRVGTAKLLQQAAAHAASTRAQQAIASRRRRGQPMRSFKEQQERRKLADRARHQIEQASEQPVLERTATTSSAGGAAAGAFSTAADVKKQHDKSRKAAAGRGGGRAGAGGYQGIITMVQRREQQRQEDIRRRQDAWRQHAGLPTALAPPELAPPRGFDLQEEEEYSDMPELPDTFDWEATAPAAFGRSQPGDGTTAGESGEEAEDLEGEEAGGRRNRAPRQPQQQLEVESGSEDSSDASEATKATEDTVQQPAAAAKKRVLLAKGGAAAGQGKAAAAAPTGHPGKKLADKPAAAAAANGAGDATAAPANGRGRKQAAKTSPRKPSAKAQRPQQQQQRKKAQREEEQQRPKGDTPGKQRQAAATGRGKKRAATVAAEEEQVGTAAPQAPASVGTVRKRARPAAAPAATASAAAAAAAAAEQETDPEMRELARQNAEVLAALQRVEEENYDDSEEEEEAVGAGAAVGYRAVVPGQQGPTAAPSGMQHAGVHAQLKAAEEEYDDAADEATATPFWPEFPPSPAMHAPPAPAQVADQLPQAEKQQKPAVSARKRSRPANRNGAQEPAPPTAAAAPSPASKRRDRASVHPMPTNAVVAMPAAKVVNRLAAAAAVAAEGELSDEGPPAKKRRGRQPKAAKQAQQPAAHGLRLQQQRVQPNGTAAASGRPTARRQPQQAVPQPEQQQQLSDTTSEDSPVPSGPAEHAEQPLVSDDELPDEMPDDWRAALAQADALLADDETDEDSI